jgi:hypothetical protein
MCMHALLRVVVGSVKLMAREKRAPDCLVGGIVQGGAPKRRCSGRVPSTASAGSTSFKPEGEPDVLRGDHHLLTKSPERRCTRSVCRPTLNLNHRGKLASVRNGGAACMVSADRHFRAGPAGSLHGDCRLYDNESHGAVASGRRPTHQGSPTSVTAAAAAVGATAASTGNDLMAPPSNGLLATNAVAALSPPAENAASHCAGV